VSRYAGTAIDLKIWQRTMAGRGLPKRWRARPPSVRG
jgi:hypothetical protein